MQRKIETIDKSFAESIKNAIEEQYKTSGNNQKNDKWVQDIIMKDAGGNEVEQIEQCTNLIILINDKNGFNIELNNEKCTAKVSEQIIQKEPEKIEIELDKQNIILITIQNANMCQLSPKVSGITSSYTIEWSSSDEAVASVDSNGVITAKGQGTAEITAKISGMENVKASCQVEVKDKICEFTDGLIATSGAATSWKPASLGLALTALTDGKRSGYDGTYNALLLSTTPNNAYLYFTLNANVKISFSSDSYKDGGGNSGQAALFYKENNGNYDSLHYRLVQMQNTQLYGEYYFPAGKYKLVPAANYVTFDEWDFEVVN